MYVRASTFTADPAKIDAGMRYVQETVQPALESTPGNRGISASIDEETGQGAVVSWWDDLDSLRASEDQAGPLRDEAGTRFGATMTPRVLEVVERHVREAPRPGCWNRVTTIRISPTEVDKSIDTFRTSTVPALDAMDGFCAAVLSADRDAGIAVAVTTWRDRASVEGSRERAVGLREEVADKAQGTVESVQEMPIVLFSIRAG